MGWERHRAALGRAEGEGVMGWESGWRTLARAKEANPWWFRAMMRAARVMSGRRKKYSGASDPFTNFVLTARAKGVAVQEVFRDYLTLKLARHMVDTGDFSDEGATDTDLDMGNYAFLSAGWRSKEPADRVRAMLAAGAWVEIGDLRAAFGVDVRRLAGVADS